MTVAGGGVFGHSVGRLEDAALLRGAARFVDDIDIPGTLEIAFLRSPFAHARIGHIDCAAARAVPGVFAVYTLADLRPLLTGDHILAGLPSPAYRLEVPRKVLADGETVYVGEPVAAVLATSRYIAEDAAEQIDVKYDSLPMAADCRAALLDGAALAHGGLPHNLVAEFTVGFGPVVPVFSTARHVFADEFSLHRGVAMSIECRGGIARYDPIEDRLTLWSSTQTPHAARRLLCDLLGKDDDRVRVIAPDVGGGFGPKLVFYCEDAVLAASAILSGRPVKWIEDRREHFMATTQERDQYWAMEIACDDEARILGVRGSLIHDHGAYTARGVNIPQGAANCLTLPYNIAAYHLDIKLALTNKVPVTPIRGAGQPQGAFVMERLIDRMAAELGLDRAEVRRRNLVGPGQMPCEKPLRVRGGGAVILDSGDYPATQASALAAAGWKDFPARQKAARTAGRHIGIGLANYVEATGRGPFEPVRVRVGVNGRIHVASGATAMGQSTNTMLAQIVAEQLGGDIANVAVTTGDSAAIERGMGGFNSRQAVIASSSAHAAARAVREKALFVAGHLLEAAIEDLELVGQDVRIKGVAQKRIGLGEIARALEGLPGYPLPGGVAPGLEAEESVIIDDMVYSNGTAVAEVAVDIETGAVEITRFTIAHDCGKLIHPQIVEGQIVGGIAHGIGNALFERMVFDEQAQPLTTNLGDYLLAGATEMPPIEIIHRESPALFNDLGIKGVGESGVIPTPAAIIAAIEDALSPFGVQIAQAPLSPPAIVDLIERAIRAGNL